MGYDIEVRTMQPQPFAFIPSKDVAFAEIGKALMGALPEVFAYVQKHGGPASAPLIRYTQMHPTGVDMEAGVATLSPVEPTDRIQTGELAGGEVAFTVHTGSYQTVHQAYAALDRWLEENGRARSGGPWEIYVDDPQETPVEELRTEIYLPFS